MGYKNFEGKRVKSGDIKKLEKMSNKVLESIGNAIITLENLEFCPLNSL